MLRHQLPIVLVGGHHIGVYASSAGNGGQRSYHIVGFVARYFQDGDAEGCDDFFYNRYREADVLGSFFALCLILFVGFVAESRPGRVESHANVGRLLAFEYIGQGVDKAKNGRGVHPLRVDAGILDERIIGAIDECVGIEEEEFFHILSVDELTS